MVGIFQQSTFSVAYRYAMLDVKVLLYYVKVLLYFCHFTTITQLNSIELLWELENDLQRYVTKLVIILFQVFAGFVIANLSDKFSCKSEL